MLYSHQLHPLAYADIIGAYEWYEIQKDGLGEQFVSVIKTKIEAIIANPENFSVKGNKNYREAIVTKFPFIIVYRIYKHRKQIFISSVHHAKKRPRKKYRR